MLSMTKLFTSITSLIGAWPWGNRTGLIGQEW